MTSIFATGTKYETDVPRTLMGKLCMSKLWTGSVPCRRKHYFAIIRKSETFITCRMKSEADENTTFIENCVCSIEC